jgi:hypothetical protein
MDDMMFEEVLGTEEEWDGWSDEDYTETLISALLMHPDKRVGIWSFATKDMREKLVRWGFVKMRSSYPYLTYRAFELFWHGKCSDCGYERLFQEEKTQ